MDVEIINGECKMQYQYFNEQVINCNYKIE